MNTHHKILLHVLLALAVGGCVATGERFTHKTSESTSQALIYVYRPASVSGMAQVPDVKLDGQPVGTLLNGGFLVTPVPLGHHQLLLTGGGNPFKWSFADRIFHLHVKTNENQYFRYKQHMRGEGNRILHSYSLEAVSELHALPALADLKRAH